MPWFALCDKLHSSVAAAKGGIAGVGAYAMAGSWCADHLTDGQIPREVAHRLAPPAAWKKAEAAGLVLPTEDGYELVGYLDGNPSREEVLARLAAKSEAKQKAGRAGGLRSGMVRRGEAEPKQTGSRTEADGKRTGSETKLPSPSPPLPLSASTEAGPTPQPPSGGGPVLQLALVGASPVNDPVLLVWTEYLVARRAEIPTGPAPRFDDKRKRAIKKALKLFVIDDVIDACRGVFLHEWFVREGHTDVSLVLRDAEHVEKFRDSQRRGVRVPYHRDRGPEREPSPTLQRPAKPGERSWTTREEVDM